MTYRQAIQILQEHIDNAKDAAGVLRDYASEQEKEYWNRFRGRMQLAYTDLGALDNKLSDVRATMDVEVKL